MVMAAERVGVTPIVRAPGSDRAFILSRQPSSGSSKMPE
jgi:hypothetical protein